MYKRRCSSGASLGSQRTYEQLMTYDLALTHSPTWFGLNDIPGSLSFRSRIARVRTSQVRVSLKCECPSHEKTTSPTMKIRVDGVPLDYSRRDLVRKKQ